MSGSVLVAIAASVGNMIQGWDNACIAGAVLYIKKEFNLQSEPTIEGLIVAMSLIGATLVTTCSGAISDWLGRRPMLIISSVLYFIGGLVMLWSPNVYILLLGRLLDGLGIGLAVTLVPVYISETSPPEIRGSLNTLPQFMGSGGMFLSYCMVFGMSLMESPNWRLMLGVLSIPSLFYFVFMIFFLPESPRWLVSKGRMLEAKRILQRLRGRDDVAGEMALLVEGLVIGGETSIEEYIIGGHGPIHDIEEVGKINLYGHDEGASLIARPIASRQGSANYQHAPLVDPLVTLFSSVHEKLLDGVGSKGSAFFPHFGSMFSDNGNPVKPEDWDEESVGGRGDDYQSDHAAGHDSDDNLHSPLISRQTTTFDKATIQPASHESIRVNNEQLSSADIGGGWQLAWQWSTKDGQHKTEGRFERIYLHQEIGADLPADGESFQAAALVSHPALYSKDLTDQHPVGPAMVHPAKATQGLSWSDLFEPGVKHALLVGIGLQILQQFSGISGVLYYTPQILEEAGVGVLLSNFGISSTSSSLLISNVITLLMLPCIAVAMRLMDISGRRALLLSTIPVLILSLIVLVIGGLVNFGSIANAAIATTSVIVYFCCFVMGFGPIPNILCSEIFPTRVRGICIAICALTFWICDIIVTYSLPLLLTSVGLTGVFAFYTIVCIISWVFVFLKVPETKGMPLEVITEFFSVGAKQVAEAKKN
ncbi:putative major facilitator, sugar transporter, major facilitator superfamily [Helianthus annuus]|uniref:Major facilitator, sugar transporter, major facilitator superfamily n=1 Tax=Helianthus annuus TaxID=4232 RepID=A0A251S8D3_HELAN|nr:monosaccharide-sensing protein 2 [Helianthus annuus]KAF5764342.1 putative major facilitator, sugar transporter, major facilitator superfamily [Helianthus annuus]KAJ0451026.1 putative major facilitator, sugar transporter, major facilitator superfamily [Helianthus annuus]KAJ0455399.1 putative major facilitator, sugar transporter, major facilitator superfamily [Helianthus annuus]KAJ0472887.1 putative major facilitator, sugar transporter, major facilitator superfamily [Helianthus annuus]KAJ0648